MLGYIFGHLSVISALCRLPIDAKLTTDASGSWGYGASLVAGGLTSRGCRAHDGQKCTFLSRNCYLLSFCVLSGVDKCQKSTFDVCAMMLQ